MFAIICWNVSDGISKKTNDVQRRKSKSDRKPGNQKLYSSYSVERRKLLWLQGGVSAILFLLMLACLIVTNVYKTDYDLHLFTGVLIPANDPNPPNPPACPVTPIGAFGLYLGNSFAYFQEFPHHLVQIRDRRYFSIDKDREGIFVNLNVFGRDGRIVAEIVKNAFTVNPNNHFKMIRPDRSTLIVFDQFNQKVLNIRFLNASAVKITGVFDFDGMSLAVGEGEQEFAGTRFSYSCLGGGDVTFKFN